MIEEFCVLINKVGWSIGMTAGFDPARLGSTPRPAGIGLSYSRVSTLVSKTSNTSSSPVKPVMHL